MKIPSLFHSVFIPWNMPSLWKYHENINAMKILWKTHEILFQEKKNFTNRNWVDLKVCNNFSSYAVGDFPISSRVSITGIHNQHLQCGLYWTLLQSGRVRRIHEHWNIVIAVQYCNVDAASTGHQWSTCKFSDRVILDFGLDKDQTWGVQLSSKIGTVDHLRQWTCGTSYIGCKLVFWG